MIRYKLQNFFRLTMWCFVNFFIAITIFLLLLFMEIQREYGVIETNASLLGFSLAAIGIFFALPLRPEIQERVHQFQFDKKISILMLVGMMSFLVGIFVFLFVNIFSLNIFFLIYGALQEVTAMYYITILFIKGR